MTESRRDIFIRLLKSKSDLDIVEFTHDAVRELIEVLEEPEQPHWIPCSERLPELDVYVIATTQWYEITIACRIGDGEWFIGEGELNAYDDDILAWMPLPEPYKGDTECQK